MAASFFTNTIWYIALAATSAAALVIIFIKAPDRKKTFAFYFAALGFGYCIEISLLLLFNAYQYYPMIRPDDPTFDSALGNIFSQVSVSSSAVLISVIGLSNWWLALFSFAYFLIDVLFTHLGVFEHFWYQSMFTLAGFFIYGLIVKYWYKRLLSGPPRWIYYPTLFLSIFAVATNLIGTILKLLDLRVFQSAFYNDPSRNHTAAGLIYESIIIIIVIAQYKWRTPRWQKIFVFLLLLVCQWGLLQSVVIATKPGWEFIILFDLAAFYGTTTIMVRCLARQTPPP